MSVFEGGFLRDENRRLLITTDATGAAWRGGFLRAPDGRLVVVFV